MKEHEIAIPFDISGINENVLHKILRKSKTIMKAIIRRTIDIIFSLIGIILLIPLTIIVFCQNLKNGENGKIFYTQNRIGKNGKIFKMYKFRTMVNNADELLKEMLKDDKIKEEYETYRKLKNDPRVTTFGKFLRSTSLDEFPQFINVIKGQMSLVGPRPYLPMEREDMGEYYDYIVQMKPGVTGPWQVAGRNDIEFSDRLEIDKEYCDRRGNRRDLRILFKTIAKVIKKEGAI